MVITIPDWCTIGKIIEWHAPHLTDNKWVKEEIVGFGYNGFFHKWQNCPVYFTEFSEYGKTVREVRK